MPKKKALIVDDEPDIRELLEITLGRMGIETLSAKDLTSAKALLQNNEFDFCMTDMNLPDGNGIELVQHINSNFPQVPVAMITAHGSIDSAVEALKAGAFDFVSKPVNLELLRSLVDTALNLKPLDTKTAIDSPSLLGETTVMIALRKQISKLARSQAPIYISGESGSGKELVARSIHENGPRAGGPFIPVNCGAIPSELMESEFFGHTKGSFTGAVADKEGLFQAANEGTLFLDEVADLPLPMQVKLLRGIQEKAIRPIGSQQELSVHVRILSATHKDLTTEVERGTFRQDLFYRINVIELHVPSLRERAEDIPVLAEDLLSRIADDYQVPKPRLSSEAINELTRYHFPGNVRELANILERAITLCEHDIIMPDNLQLTLTSPTDEQFTKPVYDGEGDAREPEEAIDKTPGSALPKDEESLDSYLENIEKSLIVDALETTRWNKTAAARKLGITFRALRYKLKKLGLD
ncbi:MAG: sigma-54-dependent Fis family transcriptional regulator [Gammaproteobacteria bacterium]|jgi:two-component system response regulator PilR (NtrC family)|nr:sigma-54-dependent Fis family transcriptional regulator [Gammaproteobacteria bacterium]MBT3866311.1 sigma-54-dependent Fis family transcriptional regulator [Gammaproteobacteria bacterium]MBT4378917.1 sigma-54-dependent Fis family transcriptional regulator [Gammaproteobacteria bacterium]MBT4619289.1 sigma-54-dependent Fis family transcriptional regulator [Gammaproteobacteria bacterium]MBT5197939.1 sigma-54-dependent Fis family transcriptional regulator [Gammaproteobacteria bacterium]